jgi:site-specific DNA recombinase
VFWDSRIREVLVSPRTAGLRHADGKLVQAEWEPILTKEQHLELRAILGPQRRERATGRLPTARSYLLGGLAYCGRCGARLRSKPSGGRRRYFCEPRYGGCGGLKRVADPMEAHVVWRLLLKLPERLLEAARRAPEEWETLGRLTTARQTEEDRLEGFADFLADETWDRPTYLRQKKRVQDRLNELDAKITHLRASAPRRRLKGATLGELQAEWDRLDLEDQRALLADHVEKVVIKPVGRGKHFDPAAVEIHWK